MVLENSVIVTLHDTNTVKTNTASVIALFVSIVERNLIGTLKNGKPLGLLIKLDVDKYNNSDSL